MVSGHFLLIPLAVFACAMAPAQAPRPLVETTNIVPDTPSSAPAAVEAPAPPLTPERRGDILMARKMYREAVETYRQAPLDSPVIWNKIGIAYHQMMQLDNAKKHYERAVKMNPKYSEAINNLGTVYYAKKSYRRRPPATTTRRSRLRRNRRRSGATWAPRISRARSTRKRSRPTRRRFRSTPRCSSTATRTGCCYRSAA